MHRTLPSSSTGLETSAAPRPRFRISGRALASEPHRLRLDHIRQAAHGVDQLSAHRLIDFDQRDRVLACGSAPEMECRDVDLCCAERMAQRADKPGFVIVADKKHVT